jgi:hypothetical protein
MLNSFRQLIFGGPTPEVAALRRQLEEAAERLIASKAQAAEDLAAALAASKAQAAEDLAAALAASEAQAEKALLLQIAASDKAAFYERMRIVASQASKLSPKAGQRLEVACQSDVGLDVLMGGPLADQGGADEGVIVEAWSRMCSSLRSTWRHFSPKDMGENKHVHPVMKAVLMEVLPPFTRLWCNEIAPDDIPFDEAQPDFLLAHARDASPSLLGSIVLVEVKKEGNLRNACLQGANYLSRRMYRVCCEVDARGEATHNLAMYGVALDGQDMQLLRMASGTPLPGEGSYATATPCPVQRSPILPLLPWKWHETKPPEPLPPPSLGFRALFAILRTATAASSAEAPLMTLRACLRLQGGGGGGLEGGEAAALPEEEPTTLHLPIRLGRGGSSDVYAVEIEAGGVRLALQGGELVLKLPRWSSAAVGASFERECSALAAMGAHVQAHAHTLPPTAPHSLPQCVALGWLPDLRGKCAVQWPLLIMQPLGVPLTAWVAGRSGGGSVASGCSVDAKPSLLRMQCATQVGLCCARALRVAHGAGWVHCDVRPSNIVVRRGSDVAVLVDWGSSRGAKEDCLGEGVAMFSHQRLHGTTSCQAHIGLDAVALLLTWVSTAWDERCDAPWGGCLPGLFDHRWKWLRDRAVCHAELRVVLGALEAMNKALRGGALSALEALGALDEAMNSLLEMHGALPPL